MSGCFFSEGPMFPRISSFFHRTNECECQAGQLPSEFSPPMPAPVLGHGAPSSMPTITTVPATQPPQLLKSPAVTTPYFPPVN
jgi:hypothetical protein